jgi:hypothetical protein
MRHPVADEPLLAGAVASALWPFSAYAVWNQVHQHQ